MTCPVGYYDLMRHCKDKKFLRFKMVDYAAEHGVKPAARKFGTTPKTVRKWLGRWKPDSLHGLDDHSRAPKNSPRRISPQQRREVISLKKKMPSFGAARLKDMFELSISDKAMRRIWREEGLLKEKRRKHKTKQDLRAVKAAWGLFRQTDFDTKDLDDIPQLWPQIQEKGLPKVQYTCREVVSGLQFIGHADERALLLAAVFAEIVTKHLEDCGVVFKESRGQSDNGSEFIGAWNAKEDSIFTKVINSVPGLTHVTIPPAAHTWQSDIETVHRIIEDEFYEVEGFTGRPDFFGKASTYNLWFNVARKNSYKGKRTPWEIIHELDPTIAPRIVMLPAIDLDAVVQSALEHTHPGGYDVLPHPYVRSAQAPHTPGNLLIPGNLAQIPRVSLPSGSRMVGKQAQSC